MDEPLDRASAPSGRRGSPGRRGPTGRRPVEGRARAPFGPVLLVLVLLVAVVTAVRWPRGGGAAGGEPSSAGAAVAGSNRGGAAPTGDEAGATDGHGSPATAPASSPAPPCGFADRPAAEADYDDWPRTLVDVRYRLPASYVPPDLVSAGQAGFSAVEGLRALVVPDLSEVREAAAAAGHPLGLIVGYRSFEQQRELFDRRVRELGRPEALRRVALPGHSEHQLGTAFDFTSAGDDDVTQAWGETPTGRWMAANAWRFGFVMSYPRGREAVTCFTYEPWHFRYVGRDRAAEVRASGLTLREFLWRELHPTGP
jgi:zinc D-Ala-D-Ala carboxypeptidase